MNGRTLPPAGEFAEALATHAAAFQVQIDPEAAASLRVYYEHLCAWNARLHLVAPSRPAEFATRHVLESLLALQFLPCGARLTDVGSGAGLPALPCLIIRRDLGATLVESSPKKAVFLREALRRLNLHTAARVVAERFEKIEPDASGFVTCRALDRFIGMFSKLIEWSPPESTLLFFGGHTLRARIEAEGLPYTAVRVPESERRFLFVVAPRAG